MLRPSSRTAIRASSPGALHRDQAGGLEPGEVRARGRRRDAGGTGELGGGARLAGEELEHDRCARPVSQRPGDLAELDLIHGGDFTPATLRRGAKLPTSRVAA